MELIRDREHLAVVSFRFTVATSGVISNVTAVRGMPASKCSHSSFMLDGKRYLQNQLWKVVDGNLDGQKQMVIRDTETDFDKAIEVAKAELGRMMDDRLSQLKEEAQALELTRGSDVALRIFEYGYK